MADEFDTMPPSGSGKASGAGQGVEGKSDRTDDSDSSPSALSLGGAASEVVKSSKTKGPTLKSSSFLFFCQQHFVFFFPHLLVFLFRSTEICLCCWVEADYLPSTTLLYKVVQKTFGVNAIPAVHLFFWNLFGIPVAVAYESYDID